MSKLYNASPSDKGALLARGHGIFSMLDKSYQNGWSDENSILEVDNPDDGDSRWRIYQRKRLTSDAMEQQRKSQR